jgi:hypothetical protein
MEVFDKILNWKFTNTESTTGLPEYRYVEGHILGFHC